MARIRTIKPEFPQSESIGRLSRDARLLFIQLWTLVDDDGRARAPSRMLASLLYPYDDDAPGLIDGWLEELERAECIRRYEVDGHTYLDIPKWLDHQKIDRKSASKLPAYPDVVASPREPSRIVATDLDHGMDLGSGGAPTPDGAAARDEQSSSRSKKGTRLSPDWQPSREDIAYAVAKGVPADKVATVAEEFRNFWVARPGKDGVKLEWSATWQNRVIQVCEHKGWAPRNSSSAASKPTIWVREDDPRFGPAAKHFERDTGKPPDVRGSRFNPGQGFPFPADYPELTPPTGA